MRENSDNKFIGSIFDFLSNNFSNHSWAEIHNRCILWKSKAFGGRSIDENLWGKEARRADVKMITLKSVIQNNFIVQLRLNFLIDRDEEDESFKKDGIFAVMISVDDIIKKTGRSKPVDHCIYYDEDSAGKLFDLFLKIRAVSNFLSNSEINSLSKSRELLLEELSGV